MQRRADRRRVQTIGSDIEKIRIKMGVNQSEFRALFRMTAMSVSRWERQVNPTSSRELINLGLLARKVGVDVWSF
jgi:DNA-binding transcriptional regulator YiaG